MALHWAMSFWADFPALSLLRSNGNTLPSTTTAFSRLASVLHSSSRSFAPYAPGSTSGSTTTRRVPKKEMVPAAMISPSISGAAPSSTVASSSLSAERMRTAAFTARRTRYRSVE